jgi:hypothetical protein
MTSSLYDLVCNHSHANAMMKTFSHISKSGIDQAVIHVLPHYSFKWIVLKPRKISFMLFTSFEV